MAYAMDEELLTLYPRRPRRSFSSDDGLSVGYVEMPEVRVTQVAMGCFAIEGAHHL